ncbi:DUF2484 family protein [Celeribacter sp.]|uniref:DUF2484 family protein n=1 Tax=Celeribacter sp. TaxID=1890673 RepID=UPI003A92B988
MNSLAAICIWALATMALAPLPMRYQMRLGPISLVTLPPLLVWLGRDFGTLPVVVCLAAAVSLFRKPLAALGRAVLGRITSI